MAFDINEYKDTLFKKIQERYSLYEVDPTDVSQGDLGLGNSAAPAPAQPNAPQQPAAPTGTPNAMGAPKAKDPELSMEVLKLTVKWALDEVASGKSKDEVLAFINMANKAGLIDFIHIKFPEGYEQQAPTSSTETSQATGEPAADDLSKLTNPEPTADAGGQAPAAPAEEPPPAPNAGGEDAGGVL